MKVYLFILLCTRRARSLYVYQWSQTLEQIQTPVTSLRARKYPYLHLKLHVHVCMYVTWVTSVSLMRLEYTLLSHAQPSHVSLCCSKPRLASLSLTASFNCSLSARSKVTHSQVQPPLVVICMHTAHSAGRSERWQLRRSRLSSVMQYIGGGTIRRFWHFICALKGRNRTLQSVKFCKG